MLPQAPGVTRRDFLRRSAAGGFTLGGSLGLGLDLRAAQAEVRCVFRIRQRHYARYTPELVEQVCGTPRETFFKAAEAMYNNAGPERTGAICYAVGKTLPSFADLKDDGTTACGAWIYTGIMAPTPEHPGGVNRAASRKSDDWVALGWGFSWPANRRLMYNRCAADPAGNPWPKEARPAKEFGAAGGTSMRGYVYWDAAQKKWIGLDVPDFVVTKAPDTPAKPNGVGLEYHDGASPFIMKADGKGWLYVPNGLVDGPMPTHYEPFESPVHNVVYKQQSNPVTIRFDVPGNTYAPVGSAEYPHVLSTYRLTEHHLSGTMSRWLPWLAELQPELFCEISPEHAAEIGVANTEWVTITTPRASIRAKALVTRRIRPYRLKDKTVHHVRLPWHWGYKGVRTGDVVNNLAALVGDPNVTIHEAKVFVCNVSKA